MGGERNASASAVAAMAMKGGKGTSPNLIATAVLNCVQGDYASAGLEYVLLMIMKYTPFIRKTIEV